MEEGGWGRRGPGGLGLSWRGQRRAVWRVMGMGWVSSRPGGAEVVMAELEAAPLGVGVPWHEWGLEEECWPRWAG